MTKEEEAYWCGLINQLNEKFTLEYLAKEFDVTVRTISNWKGGDSRPMGLKAIQVYLFHGKLRKQFPETGNSLPMKVCGTSLMS